MKYALAASAFSVLLVPAVINAQQVDAGYSLYQAEPGTSFDGVDFKGVPLGNYNFGGAIGVQNVGNTDTIVQRTADATPGSSTVGLQLDALQLVSTAPVSIGGGPTELYYITLGNTASTGNMSITWNPNNVSGTFSSTLDVNLDIRAGSLTGPVVQTITTPLTSTATDWGTNPPPGSILINGADYLLNGTTTSNDLWTLPPLTSGPWMPQGGGDDLSLSAVPDTGATLGLLGFAAACCIAGRRLRNA